MRTFAALFFVALIMGKAFVVASAAGLMPDFVSPEQQCAARAALQNFNCDDLIPPDSPYAK